MKIVRERHYLADHLFSGPPLENWHRLGDDFALVGRLDFAGDGCIAIQRLMRPRLVIVAKEIGDDAAQMVLAQDFDMIKALAAQRASEALDERFAGATVAQSFLRISETQWNFCDVPASKPIATSEGAGMHDCRAGRMRKLNRAKR
jgi:hypothetical protein